MIAGEDVLGRSWPNLLLGADGLIACMLDASTEFEDDDDDPQRLCWKLPPVRGMAMTRLALAIVDGHRILRK